MDHISWASVIKKVNKFAYLAVNCADKVKLHPGYGWKIARFALSWGYQSDECRNTEINGFWYWNLFVQKFLTFYGK